MAKNPNKKAKALQKDEQMNGAMPSFSWPAAWPSYIF